MICLILRPIFRRVNENALRVLFNRINDKSDLVHLTHKVYQQSRHGHGSTSEALEMLKNYR